MDKFKIKYNEVYNDVVGENKEFPKYTTQILNLANQNAQATRPKIVGQMSELIQEFPGQTYEEWLSWYNEMYPDSIEEASKRIKKMINSLRVAIELIDEKMIRKWVEDLVIDKTYIGMKFQESILKRIALRRNLPYHLAKPQEESKGIDGYIGDIPVSIKPITYKYMNSLSEEIDVSIVYYEKKKDGITVITEFD